MRVSFLVLSCALVFIGCSGSPSTPAAPTPSTVPVQLTGPSPVRAAEPPDLQHYSVASFDDGIRSRVTDADFICAPGFSHYCKGFLMTVPSDGRLVLEMTWRGNESYPLDFDIYDPRTRQVWYSFAAGDGRRLTPALRVYGGVMYPITVWSAYVPGMEFQLTPTLRPE
jgi:hypothetical protein